MSYLKNYFIHYKKTDFRTRPTSVVFWWNPWLNLMAIVFRVRVTIYLSHLATISHYLSHQNRFLLKYLLYMHVCRMMMLRPHGLTMNLWGIPFMLCRYDLIPKFLFVNYSYLLSWSLYEWMKVKELEWVLCTSKIKFHRYNESMIKHHRDFTKKGYRALIYRYLHI